MKIFERIDGMIVHLMCLAVVICICMGFVESGTIRGKLNTSLLLLGNFFTIFGAFWIFLKGVSLAFVKSGKVKFFKCFLQFAFVILLVCLLMQIVMALKNFDYGMKVQISGLLGVLVDLGYFEKKTRSSND